MERFKWKTYAIIFDKFRRIKTRYIGTYYKFGQRVDIVDISRCFPILKQSRLQGCTWRNTVNKSARFFWYATLLLIFRIFWPQILCTKTQICKLFSMIDISWYFPILKQTRLYGYTWRNYSKSARFSWFTTWFSIFRIFWLQILCTKTQICKLISLIRFI